MDNPPEISMISTGNRVRVLVELNIICAAEGPFAPAGTIGVVAGFEDPYVIVVVEEVRFQLLPTQFEIVHDSEE